MLSFYFLRKTTSYFTYILPYVIAVRMATFTIFPEAAIEAGFFKFSFLLSNLM
jgi:hypothetical protein